MKALVLSSGGVDSTTCLAEAVARFGRENVHTVSFFYGQKHSKELDCAQAVADYYGVKNHVLDLSAIFAESNCSLLYNSTDEISHETYAEQIEETGRVSTYVPFRNGLMISAAASLAMSLFGEENTYLYIGAHADDAVGNAYPDCSKRFMEDLASAILMGTYGQVNICSPIIDKNKAQVIELGIKLKTPYHLTWSCYEGGDKPCGKCATCKDRAAAFEANGIKDPALEA